MRLSTDKLIELSHGAVRVIEECGKVNFYRFTEEQQQLYKNAGNESFYLKTFAPAGIRLGFCTDSSSLFLKVNIPFSTTRSYFSVDVCVNGEMVGSINNYQGMDMTGDYTTRNYPIGCFEKNFELGCGEKNVTIFLPWSVPAEIEEISIDDGSFAEPVVRNKKMLVFGDSITQGYDALHPSKHYTVILSELLKSDVYNKAVGGEKFIPSLVNTDEDLVPDYIIVAYGTNDWSHTEIDRFKNNCKEFYTILSHKYSNAKIFALTPIWRRDYKEQHNCGDFSFVADYIKEVTAQLDNVYCLYGFDFVPHQEKMFGDLKLHPNDDGFEHFASNLYEAIRNTL